MKKPFLNPPEYTRKNPFTENVEKSGKWICRRKDHRTGKQCGYRINYYSHRKIYPQIVDHINWHKESL